MNNTTAWIDFMNSSDNTVLLRPVGRFTPSTDNLTRSSGPLARVVKSSCRPIRVTGATSTVAVMTGLLVLGGGISW